MSTNDIIDRLVSDLQPVGRGAVARRIAIGAVIGIIGAAVIMVIALGPRHDFAAAIGTGVFWLKAVYALLLGAVGFWAVTRLARPIGDDAIPRIAAGALATAMAGVALSQLIDAPAAIRGELILGTSALVCPWLIAVLAAPVIAGLFWAIRGLAPTRLRAVGFAAGLAGGSFGAWVYAFHCPESAIPFIAIWYTAGIGIAGLAGLLLGPRLLRW